MTFRTTSGAPAADTPIESQALHGAAAGGSAHPSRTAPAAAGRGHGRQIRDSRTSPTYVPLRRRATPRPWPVIPALVLGFTFSAAVTGLLLLQHQRPKAAVEVLPRTVSTVSTAPGSDASFPLSRSVSPSALPMAQVRAGRTYRATVLPGNGGDPLGMAISWEESPETVDGVAARAAKPGKP
jgi:hypothetical protein